MQTAASRVSEPALSASAEEPLSDRLKSYFDSLTTGPTPDRLLRLTEALEAAFERGELHCGDCPPRR